MKITGKHLLLTALAVEFYFVQQKADYGLMGAALVLLLFLCLVLAPIYFLQYCSDVRSVISYLYK